MSLYKTRKLEKGSLEVECEGKNEKSLLKVHPTLSLYGPNSFFHSFTGHNLR